MDKTEVLLNWMGLTCILLAVVVAIIISEAWSHGRDYITDKHYTKARRLNWFEKWCDGFLTLLKM